MICPGVNRPPPMASELERKPAELEGLREERCGGLAGCEGVRRGVAGAMVSPSPPVCSSTNVAPPSKSTRAPQLEQKRPVEEISMPQEGQNIPGGFYHCPCTCPTPRLRGHAFDLHSGPIGEDFRDSLHYFRSVIAHGDDGVGAVLRGVLQQQLESVFARLFAEIGENRDIAADNGLQRRSQISDHAARAHDDSAHHAIVPDDAIPSQLISGGDHGNVYAIHNFSWEA